ncbi:SemiSWEET transporter [Tolumonas auensis]|uniref:SemiSWEET family sugar transporter n=1 Tax=Tolumonas auensis TaxID=43948 RepID=UPI002AA76930|nr:SemiSWEET transporter [Tolumonas auensis]
MDASLVELLGMTAGCLTTGSFIPQAIKIMRTRDVSGISLLMYIALAVGLMLWLLYGIINGQISIIAANGVTLALVLIILFMKIRYR